MKDIQLGNNVLTWNLVIGFSVLLFAATLAFDLLVPKPSKQQAYAAHLSKKSDIEIETLQAKRKLEEAQTVLETYTFQGHPETVTPKILEQVSAIARNHNIAIKSFRPQKTDAEEGIARLPFVVLVEGTYPNLVSFVKALDEPSVLLGVNLLQVSAADGETDRVNATLGLVAVTVPTENQPQEQTAENGQE